MIDEQESPAAVSPNVHKAYVDAMTRVRDVPPSTTLIDRIAEDHWGADGAEWDISCGSEVSDPDELDAIDDPVECAA